MTALRCNVSDLLHHPAARRSVHVEIPGRELGGIAGDKLSTAPLVIDVALDHVNDGIVAHGKITAEIEDECSRCLRPIRLPFSAPIRELFERTPVEGETYPLEGDELDLELPVRDAVLLDLSAAPVCREDCAGLCSVCGIDRNESDCDCDPIPADPRWDALSALTFDD